MGIDNRLDFIDEPGSDRRCPCRGREQGPRARDRGKGRGGGPPEESTASISPSSQGERRCSNSRRSRRLIGAQAMHEERERERERERVEGIDALQSIKTRWQSADDCDIVADPRDRQKKTTKNKTHTLDFFFLALHSSSMSSSSSSFQSFCQKCAYLYFFLNSSTISDFLFSFGFLFVCLFVCFLGVRVRWCPVNQYDAASGNRSRRGKKKIKEIRFPFAAWQPISGPGIWPTWLAMAKWKNLSSRPFNALRIPGWSRNLCVVV